MSPLRENRHDPTIRVLGDEAVPARHPPIRIEGHSPGSGRDRASHLLHAVEYRSRIRCNVIWRSEPFGNCQCRNSGNRVICSQGRCLARLANASEPSLRIDQHGSVRKRQLLKSPLLTLMLGRKGLLNMRDPVVSGVAGADTANLDDHRAWDADGNHLPLPISGNMAATEPLPWLHGSNEDASSRIAFGREDIDAPVHHLPDPIRRIQVPGRSRVDAHRSIGVRHADHIALTRSSWGAVGSGIRHQLSTKVR